MSSLCHVLIGAKADRGFSVHLAAGLKEQHRRATSVLVLVRVQSYSTDRCRECGAIWQTQLMMPPAMSPVEAKNGDNRTHTPMSGSRR